MKDSFSPSLFLPIFSPHYTNIPFSSKKVLLVEGAHIFLFYSRLTSQIKNLMFSNFLRLTLATHSNMFKGENLVSSNPFLSGNFGASAYLKNTLQCWRAKQDKASPTVLQTWLLFASPRYKMWGSSQNNYTTQEQPVKQPAGLFWQLASFLV